MPATPPMPSTGPLPDLLSPARRPTPPTWLRTTVSICGTAPTRTG